MKTSRQVRVSALDAAVHAESHAPAARESPLRVLIANEESGRMDALRTIVSELGYEATVCGPSIAALRNGVMQMQPDAVLVGRHGSDAHAFELIGLVVHELALPALATLPTRDLDYIRDAAKHGVFGYFVGLDGPELHAALDVAIERHSHYVALQAAFERRARLEQAKGILMARQGIDADAAFHLMRTYARRESRRVVDIAEAVVTSHLLFAHGIQPDEHETGPDD